MHVADPHCCLTNISSHGVPECPSPCTCLARHQPGSIYISLLLLSLFITIITIKITVNDSIIWGVACTGAMGVPAPVHVPGDCYVWGSSDPNSSGSKSAASTVPGWLNSSVPTLVDNTTHLDVCEV